MHSRPEEGEASPRKLFFADVMLGKLARWLRILGFDTLYGAPADLSEVQVLMSRGRIVLTRTRRWSGVYGVLILEANDPMAQLAEVARRVPLYEDEVRFLSRCVRCNVLIHDVPRSRVFGHVPDYTYETQERFAQCPSCGRFYWAGSHPSRMQEHLQSTLRWKADSLRGPGNGPIR